MGISSVFPAVVGEGLPVLMLPVPPMIDSPKEKEEGPKTKTRLPQRPWSAPVTLLSV